MSDRTEQACTRHADRILAKANVVGIAGGDDRVLVLVTAKQPLSTLATDDVVDEQVDGIDTDVVEVGTIEALLAPGASIGIPSGGTGTYGGPVVDETGTRYLLTNNHVAAASNGARVLTEIVSPGPADGTGQPIGRLARFEPIWFDALNWIDAALVRADGPLGTLPHATTTTGRVGWTVHKTGRTSGHTTGKIIGRNATVDIGFGSGRVARFAGQIITDHMLDPGDSGSVLLSRAGHPVGLGFAGSPTVSLHNPINLVLRTLGVRFAGPND